MERYRTLRGLFIPLQSVEFRVYFVQNKEHVFLESDTQMKSF